MLCIQKKIPGLGKSYYLVTGLRKMARGIPRKYFKAICLPKHLIVLKALAVFHRPRFTCTMCFLRLVTLSPTAEIRSLCLFDWWTHMQALLILICYWAGCDPWLHVQGQGARWVPSRVFPSSPAASKLCLVLAVQLPGTAPGARHRKCQLLWLSQWVALRLAFGSHIYGISKDRGQGHSVHCSLPRHSHRSCPEFPRRCAHAEWHASLGTAEPGRQVNTSKTSF